MTGLKRRGSVAIVMTAMCTLGLCGGLSTAQSKAPVNEQESVPWKIKEIKPKADPAPIKKDEAAKPKKEEKQVDKDRKQAELEKMQLQAKISKMLEDMVALKLQAVNDKLLLMQGEIKRDGNVSDRIERMLLDIVAEAQEAVKETVSQKQKIASLSIEISIYDLLARDAMRKKNLETAGERIAQLLAVSGKLENLNRPNGQARGIFWRLQAEMMDNTRMRQQIQKRSLELGKRDYRSTQAYWQNKTIQQIERALVRIERIDKDVNGNLDASKPRNEIGAEVNEIHKAMKLGLLALYAQSGATAEASTLLEEIHARWANDPQVQQGIIDAEAMCEQFGEPFDFQIVTLAGKLWKPEDFPNIRKVIIFTDARMLSDSEWKDTQIWLHRLGLKHDTTGATVLQVIASEQNVSIKSDLNSENYALAKMRIANDDAIAKLGITSLPWIVVLDAENKVQAVGQTTGIFHRQFADINKKPQTKPAIKPDAETKPTAAATEVPPKPKREVKPLAPAKPKVEPVKSPQKSDEKSESKPAAESKAKTDKADDSDRPFVLPASMKK